jgi:hypothetical protein
MLQPNLEGMDQDLTALMNGMLKLASMTYPQIPEALLRQKIVALHLQGLVQVILVADDPETPVKLNLKALCLGLLATADWLNPEEVPDVSGNDSGPSV